MTRVWSEGFEMQDLVGYTTAGGIIDTTYKRSGNAAFIDGSYNYGYLTKAITGVSEFFVRFATYLKSGTTVDFIWKNGGTTLGTISINSSGISISANGLTASGSTILSMGIWYLIEAHIKIDDATGAVEVKLEGNSECSVSGDTKIGAITTSDSLLFSGSSGSYPDIRLDDIALNDTAGGVDDSWCGDGKIIIVKPSADTATLQLTPSAAVDHYTLVDDIPSDSDTTYVESSVDDEEDIYDLAACGLSDVIITRIWTEARAKDTAASGLKVALITKASGGSEVSGGDVALAGGYTTKVLGAEQRVNPVDSAAWEVADIDALQGGVRKRS